MAKKRRKISCVLLSAFFAVNFYVSVACAAETPAPVAATAPPAPVIVEPEKKELRANEDIFSGSLFFSAAEIAAIKKALEGQVSGTAVLQKNDKIVVIPKKRVISLAGIVYEGPRRWTVWINGKKVTPNTLLPEIVDISVQKDRIHLKWFDLGINNIITLTLRPHQRYDIVTGVLLPG